MKDQLDRIEWKLDQILAALAQSQTATAVGTNTPTVNGADHPAKTILSRLTTKQHATLQMLVDGCSNQEIAERLDVTTNTIKGNIKSIANRCGVKTRVQIVLMLEKELAMTQPDDYVVMSGGLPIDWHDNFKAPDPFFNLYGWKKHEPRTKT